MRIESKMRPSWSRLKSLVIMTLLLAGTSAGMVLAFGQMTARTGSPEPDYIRGLAYLGVFLVFAIALAVWLLSARERITLHDDVFVHERFMGPFQLATDTYHLLTMKGLRCDGPAPAPRLTSTSTPEQTCVDAPTAAVPPLTLGWRLAVWYDSEPLKFGYTLEPDEVPGVVDAIVGYEQALRARLGMEADKGLLDLGVWTDSRTLALDAGLYTPAMFTGRRYSRKSDWDR